MEDEPFFTPNQGPAALREPKLAERLCTLLLGVKSFRADLRDRGEFGVELKLFLNGELIFGRRFEERWQAEHEASIYREHLRRVLIRH